MRARMCSWDVVFVVLLIVTSKGIRMRGVGRRAVFPMFQPIATAIVEQTPKARVRLNSSPLGLIVRSCWMRFFLPFFCDTTFYFCDADAFQALMNSELGVLKFLQAGIQTNYIYIYMVLIGLPPALRDCLLAWCLSCSAWTSGSRPFNFWLFPRGMKSGECLLSRPPGALDEARRELKRSQKERLS